MSAFEIAGGEEREGSLTVDANDDDEAAFPSRPDPIEVHELLNAGEPLRLDRFLCENLPGRSRVFFQRLIENGHVTVVPEEREVKASLRLPRGSRVRVEIPPPVKPDLSPQDMPIRILHEDSSLAVIDKAAGVTVHPAPNQATHTLVNALLFHLKDLSSIGGEERPGIVHRLDKETSGVLVVAKNDAAHHSLSSQFKDRTVVKTYVAVTRGEPEHMEGRIDLHLGQSYTHAKKQMVRSDGTGREAVTDYRVVERFRGYSLVECHPHTGRTHQIRVHLASLRLPVACDKLYGREKAVYLTDLIDKPRAAEENPILSRQALHAASIAFRHPASGERMLFEAPLHDDMQGFVEALRTHRAIGR